MKEKTAVAVYLKCEGNYKDEVIPALLRLKQASLSIAAESPVLFAFFDLPDALCYSVTGDEAIIGFLKRTAEMVTDGIKEKFILAVRNRKYVAGKDKKAPKGKFESHYFCGENGSAGIIDLFIRAKKGSVDESEFAYISDGSEAVSASYVLFMSGKEVLEAGGYERLQKELRKNGADVVFPGFVKGSFGDCGLYRTEITDGKRKAVILKEVVPAAEILPDEEKREEIKRKKGDLRFAVRALDAVADGIFPYLYDGFPEIKNLDEACGLVLCLVCLRICQKIGRDEYYRLSKASLELCRNFSVSGEESAEENAEALICVKAAKEAAIYFSAETPSLLLLESEYKRLEEVMITRCAENSAVLLLCKREFPCVAEKAKTAPEVLKLMLFPEADGDYYLRLSSVFSRGNGFRGLCLALLSVTTRLYETPLEKILKINPICFCRLGFVKKIINSGNAELIKHPDKTALAKPLVFREVMGTFSGSGCDSELLSVVSLLENTVRNSYLFGKSERGDGKLNVVFACEEVLPIARDIVRAYRAAQSVTLGFIIKKTSKADAEFFKRNGVKTFSPEDKAGCEKRIDGAAYFRQLTPNTTFSELWGEIETKNMKEKALIKGVAETVSAVFDDNKNGAQFTVPLYLFDAKHENVPPSAPDVCTAKSTEGESILLLTGKGGCLLAVLPDGRSFFDGETRRYGENYLFARKTRRGESDLFIVGKAESKEKIEDVLSKCSSPGYFESRYAREKEYENEIVLAKKAFECAEVPFPDNYSGFAENVFSLFSGRKINEEEVLALCGAYMTLSGSGAALDTVIGEDYPYTFFIFCQRCAEKLSGNPSAKEKETVSRFLGKCRRYGKNAEFLEKV